MVAEPVTEAAEPTEVVEPIAPNSTPEAEVVQQEPEDNYEDVLELLSLPDEGEEGGAKADTKAKEPAAKPRTVEELQAEADAKAEQKIVDRETARNRTAQVEGMRRAYQDFRSDILTIMADPMLTEAERAVKAQNRTDQQYGHFNALYQNDVQQAHSTGVEGVRTGVIQAVTSILDKGTAEAILNANHPTWDAYLEDYGERYAKKKGYLAPAEVTKLKSDVQLDTVKKVEKLTGIKMPRGGEAKKIGSAMGGGGRGYTLDQIDNMPTSEWMAIGDAPTRQRILAEARARANR